MVLLMTMQEVLDSIGAQCIMGGMDVVISAHIVLNLIGMILIYMEEFVILVDQYALF